MYRQLCALFLVCNFIGAYCADCNEKYQIACYWGSWSLYRTGLGEFQTNSIDPKLCTNIVYSFVGLNNNLDVSSIDSWADIEKGGFKNLTSLKADNPCLKTTVAIGGWNEGSIKYSVVSASEERRKKFADTILNLLAYYNFDGLDLDWEFPAARGGLQADKQNFVELLKEVKSKISPWNYRLSVSIPFHTDQINAGYDIGAIAKIVDSIRVMAYDHVLPTSGATGLSSPMSIIKETIPKLIAEGAPREKLILGIPAYGRSFQLANKNNNGIGAAVTGPGEPGYFTKEQGFLAYHEVLDMIGDGMKSVTEDGTKYAYKDLDWITYDDEETVTIKVQYAVENNLAGIMFWSLDLDDFRGRYKTKFPLLRAINKALSRM